MLLRLRCLQDAVAAAAGAVHLPLRQLPETDGLIWHVGDFPTVQAARE